MTSDRLVRLEESEEGREQRDRRDRNAGAPESASEAGVALTPDECFWNNPLRTRGRRETAEMILKRKKGSMCLYLFSCQKFPCSKSGAIESFRAFLSPKVYSKRSSSATSFSLLPSGSNATTDGEGATDHCQRCRWRVSCCESLGLSLSHKRRALS